MISLRHHSQPSGMAMLSALLWLFAVAGVLEAILWLFVLEPDPKRLSFAPAFAPLNWLVPLIFSFAAAITAIAARRVHKHLPRAYLFFGAATITLFFVEMSERHPLDSTLLVFWYGTLGVILALLFCGYLYARRTITKGSVL